MDDLQEQIFNTAWTTVLIHTQTYPSTKFPVHVIFFCLHALFSRNFTVYLHCYVVVDRLGDQKL